MIKNHKKSLFQGKVLFPVAMDNHLWFTVEEVKIMLGIVIIFSTILYTLMPNESTLILTILISNLVLIELNYYKNDL